MTKNKKHSFSPLFQVCPWKVLYPKDLGFRQHCFFPHPAPLPFLYPCDNLYQSAIEQNMQPEVEVEMNGQVTDQLSQLTLCSLDTWTHEGPCFAGEKKIRAQQTTHKRRIRNAILEGL